MISPAVIQFIIAHHVFGIFLGSVFFGESVILTAAFLSGQGLWSPVVVWWVALLGTVFSDSVWFLFGRQATTFVFRRYQKKYETVLATIEERFGTKPFLALLFIKFLYGTRILTLLYLATRRLRFSTFLFFDTAGAILWLTVMVLLGWLAGRGSVNLISYFGHVEVALLVLVLVFFTYQPITVWLSNRLLKK
ncbi:MAG: VTT domain-containing protein [Patescibacteria group bacterium]|jgi:membrane protein DedA with SNARE-associated domain